jgi:endo-1,4-beta-xylanase
MAITQEGQKGRPTQPDNPLARLFNKKATRRGAIGLAATGAAAAGAYALFGGGKERDSSASQESQSQVPVPQGEVKIGPLDTSFIVENLPRGLEQIYLGNAQPTNLVLRRGSEITAKGIYATDAGESVVISVTDPLRKNQDGKAQSFSGLIPLWGGGERSVNSGSFNDILTSNGGKFDADKRVVTYKDGKQGELKTLSPDELEEERTKMGAFFVDLDPLRLNPDGSRPLHENPIVPAVDPSIQGVTRISQLRDGRVVGLGGQDGRSPITRARYIPWRGAWEWQVRPEAVSNYTIRELADASNISFGVLNADIQNNPGDPTIVHIHEQVANELVVGNGLNQNVVFNRFTQDDWRRVINEWSTISSDFAVGKLPQGYNFNWNSADSEISFAEKTGMKVRVQHLLWGIGPDKIHDSIYNGNFSKADLEKILEFAVKTRVLKYKGRVQEWDIADEIAMTQTFSTGRDRFWFDRLGDDIADKVAIWKNEVDPESKSVYVDDHVFEQDNQNFRRIRERAFQIMRHFKAAQIPVHKVAIENNIWVHAAPTKQSVATDLQTIKDLGYEIGSSEMTVNVDSRDPFWTDRRAPATLPNQYEAQARVYRDFLEAYAEAGGNFGIGGLTDSAGWFTAVGHPQTKAMIFDDAGSPKPAYYAMLDALKNRLESSGVLSKAA